jgi:protein tyrosine phosphatase (PTP) superfamily phosphohydrolase (DUF442 family)
MNSFGRHGGMTLILCIGSWCAVGCATTPGVVRNVHTVAPGTLVRGAQPDEHGFRRLRDEHGIAAVINLNDDTAEREESVVTGLGMKYLALPSNALRPEADKVMAFLRAVEEFSPGGAVYVHCRHGMDRTGFAVAAYRIVVEGWNARTAMAELRSHQAFPHALLFPAIGPFVERVYRDRESWRTQLARSDARPEKELAAASDLARDGGPGLNPGR